MTGLAGLNRRLLLTCAASATAVAGRARARTRRASAGGRDAFAALEGRWRVIHSRRIGKAGWTRLDGTCLVSALLGGLGHVEDHRLQAGAGEAGRASLRLFDPATGAWSAWAMGRAGLGVGPRLTGRLEGEELVFYGAEMRAGRPVNLRQTWSGLSGPAPRWTQAVSADGGLSWRADYAMDFVREA